MSKRGDGLWLGNEPNDRIKLNLKNGGMERWEQREKLGFEKTFFFSAVE